MTFVIFLVRVVVVDLNESTGLQFFYETEKGYWVYRQKAGHGGYTYWIDDVGGGRLLFDEGLDDWESLDELRKKLDG